MTPARWGGQNLTYQVDWHPVHMGHPLPYAANCSLFTEVELLKRPAAARAAGFDAIELWWPWPDQPVPPDAEIDRFVAAVGEAGVQLIGLNFAGDVAGLIVGARRGRRSSATTSPSRQVSVKPSVYPPSMRCMVVM